MEWLDPQQLAAEIEKAKVADDDWVDAGSDLGLSRLSGEVFRATLAEIEREFVKALANCEQPNPVLDPPFVKVDGVEECVAVVECSRLLVAARKELK